MKTQRNRRGSRKVLKKSTVRFRRRVRESNWGHQRVYSRSVWHTGRSTGQGFTRVDVRDLRLTAQTAPRLEQSSADMWQLIQWPMYTLGLFAPTSVIVYLVLRRK